MVVRETVTRASAATQLRRANGIIQHAQTPSTSRPFHRGLRSTHVQPIPHSHFTSPLHPPTPLTNLPPLPPPRTSSAPLAIPRAFSILSPPRRTTSFTKHIARINGYSRRLSARQPRKSRTNPRLLHREIGIVPERVLRPWVRVDDQVLEGVP